ncbi:MAG: hypothetical protein ACR2N5_08650 [Solirubrobacterales bacterium]
MASQRGRELGPVGGHDWIRVGARLSWAIAADVRRAEEAIGQLTHECLPRYLLEDTHGEQRCDGKAGQEPDQPGPLHRRLAVGSVEL